MLLRWSYLVFFYILHPNIKAISMNIIEKYFPNLSDKQKEQIAQLDALYRDWNAKINVISRKDIDNLYEHHVLHSMAIAKAIHSVQEQKSSISVVVAVSLAFLSLSSSLIASSS